MLFRLRDQWQRYRFGSQCRDILDTPPLATRAPSGCVLLSQLQHKDVIMYLLAVKSFARYVPLVGVFVVDDGSLTPEDRRLLREQIEEIQVLEKDGFRGNSCPVGGTWERLLAIASLVKDHYVVQLDSDTLALAPLGEVCEAIAQNRSFVIGTWDNQDFETMSERAVHARRLSNSASSHIQVVAESNLDHLDGHEGMRYVRGCSGFSGFARNSFGKAFVERISAQMTATLNERWSEWGTEQVMSNIVVANSGPALVLPHPKYSDCMKMRQSETVFVHFIGNCRFRGGRYASLGKEVIAELNRK